MDGVCTCKCALLRCLYTHIASCAHLVALVVVVVRGLLLPGAADKGPSGEGNRAREYRRQPLTILIVNLSYLVNLHNLAKMPAKVFFDVEADGQPMGRIVFNVSLTTMHAGRGCCCLVPAEGTAQRHAGRGGCTGGPAA